MAKEDLVYERDESFEGRQIDEGKPNSYVGIYKIRWNSDSDYKIDLRRYVVRSDDTEMPTKGISLTDEAADKVTEEMVDLGYGKTNNIVKSIINRDDFKEAIEGIGDEAVQTATEVLDALLDPNSEVTHF